MAKTRKKLPIDIETEVLIRSRRRCALCYGLKGDFGEKIGQIAHVDKDRSNDSLHNLAWLCFEHHSLYDSTTSQHKNYQAAEVKQYRDTLYRAVATSSISGPESLGRYIATESSSTVIWLADQVVVLFDWPLRCAPTLLLYPQSLAPREISSRGFQATLQAPIERESFAFFADASPAEFREEAKIQREDWRSAHR